MESWSIEELGVRNCVIVSYAFDLGNSLLMHGVEGHLELGLHPTLGEAPHAIMLATLLETDSAQ